MGGTGQAGRFTGRELDWFAVDLAGDIALFATAGAGFVPESVAAAIELHEQLADGIETPDRGTPRVWDAYAELGLFVFDWKLHAGPYARVRTPATPIAEELRARVLQLPGLPVYAGRFRASRAATRPWRPGGAANETGEA